jgi:hypothetical protein
LKGGDRDVTQAQGVVAHSTLGPHLQGLPACPIAQIQEIHPTAESKTAQDQAFNARKRLLLAAETAQQLKVAANNSNVPDDQAKAAAAQQQVMDAQKDAEVADKKAKEVQSAVIAPQDWSNTDCAANQER